MNRLDFSSIMAVIRCYISPDHGMNQGELLDELFYGLHAESNEPIIFDGASVNRWLKGTERVSPIISRFYLKKRNREKLAEDNEQYILPLMYDSDMSVQELYRLTVQDATISERKKNKLLKGYPCDTAQESAQLIAALLCFAMERIFVRRTPSNTALMTAEALSPTSADFILNNRVPVPCRHFCGREAELSTLHVLLNEHSKVFISGIPGIGKSELAKAYAKQHKDDYTNIVHLYYTGSLREDITRMDFVDDLPDDTAGARYERHARFLRTLKEDTLLIVDNFNATATEDDLLAEVMAYRCKVLFTTRCSFEEYPTLELHEISDKQTLLHLMGNFYSEAAQHQDTLQQIIDAVHSHTLAVELAARLLETGMLEPHALLAKLQAEKAAFNTVDTVNIHKDGRNTKATYYRHIHTLFSLYELAAAEQDVMRSLCFTPSTGISARLPAKWLQQDNLNTINRLIEMGFIQDQPGRIVALHPLMQEIASEELKPSVQNCRTLLDNLHEICLRHGEEPSHTQVVMQTIESIVTYAIKDEPACYLHFVEDAISFAEKYRCQRGIVALVHEMEALLADRNLGTQEDHALLLSYQAMCTNTPTAAIRIQEQALSMLSNITADNALLASNIHANLGGMYRESGNYIKAKEHMEAAITLLRKYDLLAYHDSIPQVVNYALLLSEMGQPDKAITVLEQVEKVVQAHNGESELAPFLNILNEMHARQTSKKVKAALHTKFTNGLHGGAYAPFGYMRDPEQKGHLIRGAKMPAHHLSFRTQKSSGARCTTRASCDTLVSQKGGIPMNLDQHAIGAVIRARRTEASLTQAELAERLHVSAQSVSNWERGECLPDVYHLMLLSRFLSVSADELLAACAEPGEHIVRTIKVGNACFEVVDVYCMPASQYIRVYTDRAAAQLIAKEKCEVWEMFAYIRDFLMPAHGFVMADNGSQEMEVFDSVDHGTGYAYMPVKPVEK